MSIHTTTAENPANHAIDTVDSVTNAPGCVAGDVRNRAGPRHDESQHKEQDESAPAHHSSAADTCGRGALPSNGSSQCLRSQSKDAGFR